MKLFNMVLEKIKNNYFNMIAFNSNSILITTNSLVYKNKAFYHVKEDNNIEYNHKQISHIFSPHLNNHYDIYGALTSNFD